uniref:carboxypeptidase-like regulatory domain-containing protein n=1 Tax=Cellulophaga fucicola TaxID=76595 RepID=UPI003EBA7185
MISKLLKQPKLLVFIALLFLSNTIVNAQDQKTVSGKVLDQNGIPLLGATVLLKSTSIGTTTNFDGEFSIETSTASQTLVISYVGYITKEVSITNAPLTITLTEDASALDEVIVVGYGTQKKSDLVNAVATTDLSKATLTPTSDVTEMLRGRVAGLQVEVGGGTLRPGGFSEIIFRGRSSIEGNTSAIYVVDGIIREGGIEDINSDDIKSIEVLKDASAQAIYGSRGANGVILVTTKRGESGKVNVSYHGYVTTKSIERNFDVYSGEEFAQLRREAIRSNNATNEYPNEEDAFSEIEMESIANNEFVDW